MMEKWYHSKTTLVALFGAVLLMAMVVALFMEWITHDGFVAAVASIASFLTVIIGFLAKDQTTSKQ